MRTTTKLLTVLAMAAALTPMAPASAAITDAAIANFAFSPNPVNVQVGDSVTWTNGDGAAHTVTAENDSFGSDNLSDGETFSHTFGQAGTFAYHCDIHPSMKGTVQVGAQSTTTTTAAPTTTTATASPTTVTTRATTTSSAPRSTTTAPRPTTTVTAAPTSTTVVPPTTEATPPPSETTTSTLVAAGASNDAGGGGGNGGMLAAGAALLLLLAGAGGWWARRRFRAA
jgi:plastocyanin